MKPALFTILLFTSLNSFSQGPTDLVFEEKQADSAFHLIDSILIIGMGSMPSQIFLDEVSNAVIEELTKKKVIAHYHYLGKTNTEAWAALDTLNKSGYQAILFFIPRGFSFYEVQGESILFSIPTRLGNLEPAFSISWVDYEESFNVDLCEASKEMKVFWSASAKVACVLGKPKTAKKLADKIISRFKSNHYIQ
jgi:hypothetical protein